MVKWLVLLSLWGNAFLAYPAVTFKTVQNDKITVADLQGKGKWLVINYWASWCQPCLEEIAELNRFYQLHQQQAALFGVNYEGLNIAEQLPLIKKLKISYPNLAEDPAAQLKLGAITAVPATFIFNPEGQLVKTAYGKQSCAKLSRYIQRK